MRRTHPGFYGAALAYCLLLAGCDAVALDNGETVILRPTATFSFDFQVNAPQPSLTIAANNQVDISGQLENFTKDEIVNATVTRVTLTRIQPAGRDLNELMETVALALTASGASNARVAAASALPADNEAALSVISAAVTSHVKAPRFGASLSFEDLAAPNNGIYRFDVTVELRVELEGV